MYEYITGKLADLTPAAAIIEQGGIGYQVQISLQTYASARGKDSVTLLIEEIIREDNHTLFGFFTREEREMFRLLVSVSGIGPNTARMMLSSLTTPDIRRAIQTDNVNLLKSVKGVGVKTAQRVIIDLRDKLSKTEEVSGIFPVSGNTSREEALSALVMLGFGRNDSVKALDQILRDAPETGPEELVKLALKKL
ncbi:MAG: Holliday junction DNA helicase RuvA [Bacteroidetes bacterium GWF2_49_14]|nr:MAG: Holliday junction DNA helicase RuvA [Bacteroidetes bacterium GWF2_49_14]HBB90936.1 Holliday junction branch migration protein RuvA [Bacteroidales bacterium]